MLSPQNVGCGEVAEVVRPGCDIAQVCQRLHELLPLLVAACNANALDRSIRERSLACSIAITTLTPRSACDNNPTTTTSTTSSKADSCEGSGQSESLAICSRGGGSSALDKAPRQCTTDEGILRVAVQEMVAEVPLRAKGLSTIATLFSQQSTLAMAQIELLVDLCEAQLYHEESYVYQVHDSRCAVKICLQTHLSTIVLSLESRFQAALNALEAAASAAPDIVLPRLAQQLGPDGSAPPPNMSEAREVDQERVPDTLPRVGLRVDESLPRNTASHTSLQRRRTESSTHVHCDDEVLSEIAQRRLKVAQAICQAVRRLGAMMPAHSDAIMGALLVGAQDSCGVIRQSCLACLAEAAPALRHALHPWSVELLQIIESSFEGECDVMACSAACYLLGQLLHGLGEDAATILCPRQLARLYSRLKVLRTGHGLDDARLRAHVEAALDHLRALARFFAHGSTEVPSATRALPPSPKSMTPEGLIRAIHSLRAEDRP